MGEGASGQTSGSFGHAPSSDTRHSSSNRPHHSVPADRDSLAATLCPILREVCGGRLSPVQWFRSAWQAGGASTGTAKFEVEPGRSVDVVVKLPVGPGEHRWTTGASEHANGGAAGPTPHVLAAGTELAGYDLAWLVVEKLAGDPLSAQPCQHGVESLLHSAAEWYVMAETVRPISEASPPKTEDWAALVTRAREAVRDNSLAEEQRWNDCLKHVQKALPRLAREWDGRLVNTWCHGDLHPGNAMWRANARGEGGDGGKGGGEGDGGRRCVLIDLALVHAGHWIEDALYLERLYWAKPDLLFGVKPVSYLAKCRREMGLRVDDDYQGLANLRRVLMAATVPAFLEHEGHPRYVHAALGVLERMLHHVHA